MTDSSKETTQKNTNIKNLFLDPNNYRFIDDKNYVEVEKNKITDPQIQLRTRNFLIGKKGEGIKDLIESFKKNGYLPVDQIQVEQIDKNQFGVIEGNRRVAALKVLQEKYAEEGADIGSLDPSIFKMVPIVFYENIDESHHYILMGLKHISGNKKWPAINQAKLIRTLIKQEGKTEDDVRKALGITISAIRRALRTLSLVEEYQKSDYKDQFSSGMYSIFAEIVRSTDIKKWLRWDESKRKPQNEFNMDKLFSWISEDEEVIEDMEYADEDDNIQEHTRKLDRIISQSRQVRELAKIIFDKKAVATLDESRSITQASLASDNIGKDKFKNSLNIIENQIDTANKFSSFSDKRARDKLDIIFNKMKGLIVSKGESGILLTKEVEREVLLNCRNAGFSSISIKNYRALSNVKINKLKRINIFAGINNAGKSSLLEAVYLLTRLNDIYAFFDVQRRRGKFNSELDSMWLSKFFYSEFNVSGVFDNKDVSILIKKENEEDEELDKSSYICSIKEKAEFNGEIFASQSRLFNEKKNEIHFKKIRVLCDSVLSSPFSMQNKEDILQYHKSSVEVKNTEKIIGFLKRHTDEGIKDIELAGKFSRFLVNHNSFERAVDLTQFGDGVQRIFHIALQFAAAENGVVLIDELENAIHFELLQTFIKFIRELAVKFSAQVFITSHSKECIDAFFADDSPKDDISAYTLVKEEAKITCKQIDGEKLSRLIKSIDADLRRAR